MLNPVGEQIREALERLGRSQTWLAEAAGVSPTAVTKWLQSGIISRRKAMVVAELLNLSVDQLLTGNQVQTDLDAVVQALPDDASRNQVIDFLQFKVQRSIGIEEERARYVAALERIRQDMTKPTGSDKKK